ncbi:hypothetical protein G5V58_13540 [Nocardioides anomalus]|uniref:Uncharacterized protein n=1 Tax=Nocardioides anomalus TaxID=2712223 RepID=A0A6G6WEL3_9ACTN|nr:glycosyltransferase family 39 protein [Nocardioides anomalus]QIG43646.1 hypothetical protein G5V58_13540 [Nocardioides anomalus]
MTARLSWLAAAAAALAWLPFVTKPLSPDEGGFLLVASQWHPGRSLYGPYWVDRPPLLLTVFDLAAHLGGAVALRLIGVLAVVASVLLADLLGRRAAPRRSLTPAVVAAAFLSTPLFGTTMVNGELLAVPLVLSGLVALVRSWTATGASALGWGAVAGVTAAAAALVKQNVVDVFVVAAALAVQALWARQGRRAGALVAGVVLGAAAALVACLLWAEVRGTEPVRLWDAVVTFRTQADAVIRRSANGATSGRFRELLGAAALSGAPLVLVVLALRVRRPPEAAGRPDLRVPAAVLIGWELIGIAGGGSYWLHYLIGLVPGLVLLAAAAAQRPPDLRRTTAVAVALAVASASVATVTFAATEPTYSTDLAVATYLRDHSRPRDTVVVGFGHPDIVYDSGLRSPYEELWSLPVRVRDPRLTELTHVLDGRRAPTWVVVDGTSLATWGVDASTAQTVLDTRYAPATTIGSYVVWRLHAVR